MENIVLCKNILQSIATVGNNIVQGQEKKKKNLNKFLPLTQMKIIFKIIVEFSAIGCFEKENGRHTPFFGVPRI